MHLYCFGRGKSIPSYLHLLDYLQQNAVEPVCGRELWAIGRAHRQLYKLFRSDIGLFSLKPTVWQKVLAYPCLLSNSRGEQSAELLPLNSTLEELQNKEIWIAGVEQRRSR